MPTEEGFVQQFVRLFHHYREALSPKVKQESATLNRRLIAVRTLRHPELETKAHMEDDSRRYFSKMEHARAAVMERR